MAWGFNLSAPYALYGKSESGIYMIDTFFCSADRSIQRAIMAARCASEWGKIDNIRFIQLNSWSIDKTPLEFQRYRRVTADKLSISDPYIVADDDCLIPDDFNLEECLRIFEAHPDFAIMSLLPSNASIQEWTPETYPVHNDSDVMEVASAGGIRFCRKGILQNWPPMGELPGYDKIHCGALRMAGYRVGYFRNHKMLHLGEGHSTIWTDHMVNR